MYFALVTHYGILYVVNHRARITSNPVKTHMGAAKHLFRYLAGSTDFSITYKQGSVRLVAFSEVNWVNNPKKSRSTSSFVMMLDNAPIDFKMGLQGLTAQSTMEAKLVAATLIMKGAAFCSNMVLELDNDESVCSVPLYIENTSAIHVVSNRTYSPRAKHIKLRYFFMQELVEEGKVSIQYVKSGDPLADSGVKHLSKHRHRDLMKLTNEFKA